MTTVYLVPMFVIIIMILFFSLVFFIAGYSIGYEKGKQKCNDNEQPKNTPITIKLEEHEERINII